ncbi:MAG: tetratricopeptide repeat protein [Ferruginibacter sp.]
MKSLTTLILLILAGNAIAQSTDSASFYYKMGLDEKNAKHWLVASSCFEKAIHFNPGFTEAYLENANVNNEMRRTNEAIRDYEKVYQMDPANSTAGPALMELYFGYHQYQKALDFALACKTCANAERIAALSYYKLEDYSNAEKALLKLVRTNPGDAELLYTLGHTYMDMELEKKAITYYQKAVQLDATHDQWFFELGLLCFNNQDFKNAVINFNLAAEKGFTQSLDFQENLGFAYIYSNEFDKGEKILQSVIEKKRGSKEIMRDLAQACYDQGMYDKSLDYCQKLMELDMKDGKALYQAGLCFIKKNQVERGQQMCDRAIELDPSLAPLKQKKMITGL